jgi:hypothetical protein
MDGKTRIENPARPFRLWDSVRKHDVRWSYYKHLNSAHNSALITVRWEKVGRTLEVYDVRNGKLHGTYERKINAVSFIKGE